MDIASLLDGTTVPNPTTGLEGSKSSQSASKLADSYETFLTLLTAQMKNQDPMSPMKSGEFTQQLVQFSGVEQQIQANQNLEKLSAQLAQNAMNSAASYLGKTAVVQHDVARLNNGMASWEYRNDLAPSKITLEIQNTAGDVVRTVDGKTSLGMHKINWDGTDYKDAQLPDGNYKLVINATNADGEDIQVTSFIKDIVTSIDTQGATPIYTVGAVPVGARGILALYNEG